MFKIALCDDNNTFLEHEKQMASDYLDILDIAHDISIFHSGIELLKENKIDKYDLILLDYDMEGMTGFETAKAIREKDDRVCIAFVTVYYEFSREGYRFDAIRYLVKTEDNFENELRDCIDKVMRIKAKRFHKIVFSFMDKAYAVEPEKIVYITSEKHYLKFHILDGSVLTEYKLRDKMSHVISQLEDTKMFSLIRTGQLINLKYVKAVDHKGFINIYINHNMTKILSTSESIIVASLIQSLSVTFAEERRKKA